MNAQTLATLDSPLWTILYAVLAAAPIVLSLLGVFPKTDWHSDKSVNTVFKIEMAPKSYYMATFQSIIGVYAQERVEHFLKWVTCSMFSVPFALLIHPIAGIPALMLGRIITNTTTFKRQMEIIGHSTEVYVASKNGFSYEMYLRDEAERTISNKSSYGTMFKGYSPFMFAEAMRSRTLIVKFLVALQTIGISKAG